MKKTLATLTAVSLLAAAFSMMNVSGTYSAAILSVPEEAISAEILYCDTSWKEKGTDASVKISDGSAHVENMSEIGYYTVKFQTITDEIGESAFYLGESGQLYSYEYIYDLVSQTSVPKYTPVSTLTYQEYDVYRTLNIDTGISAKIEEIPDTVCKATVHVNIDNNHYGEQEQEISIDNHTATLSSIGKVGEYQAKFYENGQDTPSGYASFYINENGTICSIDTNYESGEWVNTYKPIEHVYFIPYTDEVGDAEEEIPEYSVSIAVPSSAVTAEIQQLTRDMTAVDTSASTYFPSKGTAEIQNLTTGYFTINFYDNSRTLLGYTKFFFDEEGQLWDDSGNEISSPIFCGVNTPETYQEGNYSVKIWEVPEFVDSVEALYLCSDELDEGIWFEPEISSTSENPLIVSGFSKEGKYKLFFYKNSEVTGYADFYLGKDGNTYYESQNYNSSSKKWESVLEKAEIVNYYVSTDIRDADDYSYGNTKMKILNVPSDVKYVEVTDYETDSTFTAGKPIFPDTEIKNNTVIINNFGESGYYEINLIRANQQTAGYVFLYIDEELNIYQVESTINTDTYQIDTTLNRTSNITLDEYLNNSVVDYTAGNYNVEVQNVPNEANKILVTCSASDGTYATYEETIQISNGKAVIENLGIEGDYIITFYKDRQYLGSASFYLTSDGKVCHADYSLDSENHVQLNLKPISAIKFESNVVNNSFEYGDLDFDGRTGVKDLIIMKKYLLNLQPLSASQHTSADLNQDSKVNIFDLILLKKGILNEK